MGFERSILKLTFEADDEFRGFEVRMRRPSIEVLIGIDKARSNDDLSMGRKLEHFMSALASCLISWNLESEGVPVPATLGSLRQQDDGLVMAMLNGWIGKVSKASPPLAESSPSGAPSPARSDRMEASLSGLSS